MAGVRVRGAPLVLAVLVLSVLVYGCSSGASPTGGVGDSPGCDHWCGNGSATVTIAGNTTTISGGGCFDGGSAGVDLRFGDWGANGVGDYLTLIAHHAGGPTYTPEATPAGPNASQYPTPTVSGSVSGNPFVLGGDAVVILNADGTGFFSGTDVNGIGFVKGTFTCS
jgi:hypothetical protein